MGAAIAAGLRGSLGGAVASRLSNVDKTSLIVRAGRVSYAAGATYVVAVWYFGWRNERARNGKFPIPGLGDNPKRYAGATDAEDAPDYAPMIQDSIAPNSRSDAAQLPGAGVAPRIGGGHAAQLVQLGHIAQNAFHLHVGEHPSFGGVQAGHSANSWHKKGRAFDASGEPANIAAFANWLASNSGLATKLLELYWRGPNWVNIKDGRRVSQNYSGALAAPDKHTRHVHVAM